MCWRGAADIRCDFSIVFRGGDGPAAAVDIRDEINTFGVRFVAFRY